jgi:ribosomal protein S18 acetylase RimI-like enzyme
MEVREASRDDIEALASLLGQLGYPATQAEVDARLVRLGEDPTSSVLVATDRGRVVGLAATYVRLHLTRDRATCRLTALVVDEGSRRRGVGRALLARVVEDATRGGCERVEVTLRPERDAAKALYLSAGFEERPLRLMRPLGRG